MNSVLIRYGEIGTKSKRTRRWWERVFMKNIRSALNANNVVFSSIQNPRGRVVISTQDERALKILKNVFGISSISFAQKIERAVQDIKEEALSLYKKHAGSDQTFRISAQRLDKTFSLTSPHVNNVVGAYITEREHAQVNLSNPDLDIGIEILHHAAYVFVGRIPGYGGIPVGVQGRVLVNLKDRKSAVAAWTMLRRGCELVVCGNEELVSYLEPFSCGHPITYVSSAEKAKNILAAVFSDFELKKRKIPSFYPLLGLSEQQIQNIEALIFESAEGVEDTE